MARRGGAGASSWSPYESTAPAAAASSRGGQLSSRNPISGDGFTDSAPGGRGASAGGGSGGGVAASFDYGGGGGGGAVPTPVHGRRAGRPDSGRSDSGGEGGGFTGGYGSGGSGGAARPAGSAGMTRRNGKAPRPAAAAALGVVVETGAPGTAPRQVVQVHRRVCLRTRHCQPLHPVGISSMSSHRLLRAGAEETRCCHPWVPHRNAAQDIFELAVVRVLLWARGCRGCFLSTHRSAH